MTLVFQPAVLITVVFFFFLPQPGHPCNHLSVEFMQRALVCGTLSGVQAIRYTTEKTAEVPEIEDGQSLLLAVFFFFFSSFFFKNRLFVD